jgi:hypothetical protein
MIEVRVRDEHRVEPPKRIGVDRSAVAAKVGDATAEDRVSEHANAPQVDQDGGVSDVGEEVGGCAVGGQSRRD